jgi:hypothetical protein
VKVDDLNHQHCENVRTAADEFQTGVGINCIPALEVVEKKLVNVARVREQCGPRERDGPLDIGPDEKADVGCEVSGQPMKVYCGPC